MAFSIVGQRFTPEEFENYVAGLSLGAWEPEFVTLHNTASPTLAQRPNGFSEQNMENPRGYYTGMGWRGGPHLFIDDIGIWVFNPLTRRGTHSPCFNKIAWGVEMLGDYDSESFDSGRGAKVRALTIQALATLHRKLGIPAEALRLHKEDTCTDHDCPGGNVSKAEVIAELKAALDQDAPEPQALLVLYRKGLGDTPATVPLRIHADGNSCADVQDLSAALGTTTTATGEVQVTKFLKHFSFKWDKSANRLYAEERYVLIVQRKDGTSTEVPLDIRSDGMSWADATLLASAAGVTSTQTGAVRIVEFLSNYRFEWDKPNRELRALEG